ncbi:MAG: 2-amino-4-hydroxy-6-hydroxymethyldihydropteridine diphosphokinase [Hyphomicrobiaceae bacterium]|nr:2-amino-4-hydroxy-6-hydroxymethyldihydropteridine diphosphokinase [Hyphomicrobiaceae bacterium]
MPRAYLGLGANIGEPSRQLQEALDRLNAHPGISVIRVSVTLINPAWGKTDQPPFNNLVAEIETPLSPHDLLSACLSIETEMGRVRTEHWGPRLIDIDIIAYDREVMQTSDLVLPHPYAAQRQFVMSPLRQIAPDVANWIFDQAGVRR